MSMSKLVSLIHLVHEAKQRGLDLYDKTFFSRLDQWFFRAISDGRICPVCAELDGSIWPGNILRSGFPWLGDPIDQDVIGGQDSENNGLVHPNCRCRLIRIARAERVPVITRWED